MIDLVYNFILNVLIGENTTIRGAEDLAVMLTWTTLILIFFVLVKLVVWCFGLGSGKNRILRH